ncbi:Lactose-proton symport [Raoultella ornithinolytica]|nr:Lactose-proton symport [Raoultella ornithinolytica]
MQLLKSRKFWMFSLYVAGVAWMMFIAEQQFPRYFVSFFATKEQGNAWYGYLSTVQSGMEFVMMMFIPLLVNHYGAKRGAAVLRLRCRGQADRFGPDQRSADHLDY